jgi:hypothetical protein
VGDDERKILGESPKRGFPVRPEWLAEDRLLPNTISPDACGRGKIPLTVRQGWSAGVLINA